MIELKSSFGWLEVQNFATDPTDTDTTRGGFAIVDNSPKYYNGTEWAVFTGGEAGATAYDDIGNPDSSGSISFGAFTGTYTSATANWGGMITSNTHGNPTAGATLLTLGYIADGDADGVFLACKDNTALADTKFRIGADGATTIAGVAAGTDALTLTAGDARLTAGNLVLTFGNATLTSGNLTVSNGNVVMTQGDLTLSAGNVGITGTLSASGDFKVNTDKFVVTASSGNTIALGTLKSTEDFTVGDSTFVVTAATGATSIVGAVALTSTLSMGDNQNISLGAEGAADAYVKYDGTGDHLVFYDRETGTEKTLSQLASGFPSSPTIAGDVTITDGKLTWSNNTAEGAGVWTFAGTSHTDIAIASSVTTGKSLSITANDLTDGSMIYLDSSVAGFGASGTFVKCFDGSDPVFEVGKYGAVIIKGHQKTTDALTLTAGDFTMTSGHLTLTSGNAILTAGNLTMTLGNLAMTDGDIDMAEGKIEIDTTANETSYVKRNLDAAAVAVVEIEATHTGDVGSGLLIDHKGTGAVKALEITHAGTQPTVDISASAARTGNVINIPMANQLAETVLDITGAATGTASEGIIHVDVTGALAGNAIRVDSTGANAATGQLIYATSGGNLAAPTNGAIAFFEETGSAQATSYAVYISSTNNEGLHVDAGDVKIDDALAVGGIITAGGAINITIADTANDVALEVAQNDITNNPAAASITNAGTGIGLLLDQNGNGISLDIDSEATAADVINIAPTVLTTGHVIDIADANALTTGSILNLVSNSADATARKLVQITNDNAAAVGATCLAIQNDANTINAVFIDNNGDGNALNIDHDGSSASSIWAVKIDSDNAGAGVGGGVDFSGLGVADFVLKATATTDTTMKAPQTVGPDQFIKIDIGGTAHYIPCYLVAE